MSNSNTRKSCIVPKCTNTTTNSPEKLFFSVPREVNMRKKWILTMKRLDPIADKSTVYCCEDHFDIEKDMENYMKFKMMGGRVKLKKEVLPHKFLCQENSEPVVNRCRHKKHNNDVITLSDEQGKTDRNVATKVLKAKSGNTEPVISGKSDKYVQVCLMNKIRHKTTMTYLAALKTVSRGCQTGKRNTRNSGEEVRIINLKPVCPKCSANIQIQDGEKREVSLILSNVYRYLASTSSELSVAQLLQCTALCTGRSEDDVQRAVQLQPEKDEPMNKRWRLNSKKRKPTLPNQLVEEMVIIKNENDASDEENPLTFVDVETKPDVAEISQQCTPEPLSSTSEQRQSFVGDIETVHVKMERQDDDFNM